MGRQSHGRLSDMLARARVGRCGRRLRPASPTRYLTLPDVRPLVTAESDDDRVHRAARGRARDEGREPRRVQRWVSYRRISPNLKRAVLVAEDDAFWQHEGVDFEQLQESLETDWARGRFVRGGSTITQQLAKNLYLSPSKNPLRKLRELVIARRLEAELKKARILELYLNVIEWGDGIYGVEAAARTYSSTSPRRRPGAGGIGAARRRDRQPARAQPRASHAAGSSDVSRSSSRMGASAAGAYRLETCRSGEHGALPEHSRPFGA